MSPKRLNNGMKPSLFPVQISKILPEPPSFGGLNRRTPNPASSLVTSYGPVVITWFMIYHVPNSDLFVVGE